MFGLVKASRLRKGRRTATNRRKGTRSDRKALSHSKMLATGRPLPKAGWWQFCCCGIGWLHLTI